MNRLYKIITIVLFLLIFYTNYSHAASSYVLPYPSFMPGSKFYVLFEVKDKFTKYFYFGNFGSFKYNLSQSDKYLVEAKTLFEYKQYLLGHSSLNKSNEYFKNVKPNINNAKKSGKQIKQKEDIFGEAMLKHIEVLEKMIEDVPNTLEWNPENDSPTTLYLEKQIEEAIKLRKSI